MSTSLDEFSKFEGDEHRRLVNETKANSKFDHSPLSDSTLLGIPLLQSFTPSELARVRERFTVKIVRPGAFLLTKGARSGGIYILVRGTVKVSVGDEMKSDQADGDSEEVIIALCGPGAILGEIDALDGEGHSASVIAVEPSQLLWMSVGDFHRCQQDIPRFNHNLLRILAQRERRSTNRSNAQSQLDLAGRIARQLLIFASNYSYTDASGKVTLTIRPTQKDIAALVGSSRACVNRVLSHFKKQGYIGTESDGRLVLMNIDPLRRICRGLYFYALPALTYWFSVFS